VRNVARAVVIAANKLQTEQLDPVESYIRSPRPK